MWLVDVFLTSFKIHLDLIYTVSGPNKHSQDALDLKLMLFNVIDICNCKATLRHCLSRNHENKRIFTETVLKFMIKLNDQITDD